MTRIEQHKHDLGELISQFFVAQRNKDQTEGRGGMIDVAVFDDHKKAYEKIKGQGVMGCGDGDVVKRAYYRCETCPEIVKVDHRIYIGDSYTQKNTLGKGTYADYMPDGWYAEYSDMANDPEYMEYLRLKRKFG